MTWKQDPLCMEPQPKRYFAIHCYTCKKDVCSKAKAAASHKGPECAYLDENRKRMD